jgi:hypothetical protein
LRLNEDGIGVGFSNAHFIKIR